MLREEDNYLCLRRVKTSLFPVPLLVFLAARILGRPLAFFDRSRAIGLVDGRLTVCWQRGDNPNNEADEYKLNNTSEQT